MDPPRSEGTDSENLGLLERKRWHGEKYKITIKNETPQTPLYIRRDQHAIGGKK